MKDRDVEDPAMPGNSIPDDNDRRFEASESLWDEAPEDDNRVTRPVDLHTDTDDTPRSKPGRRLPFGLPHRGAPKPAAARPAAAARAAARDVEPEPQGQSSGKLAEYVRTRGIRGRGTPQAHQVAAPQARPVTTGSWSSQVAEPAARPAPPAVSHAATFPPAASGVADAAAEPANRAAEPAIPAAVASPESRVRGGQARRVARPAGRGAGLPRFRTTSLAANLGGRRSSIGQALRHPSRRTAFGLTGAFTTVALVGALVIVLPGQPGPSPEPTGESVYGVTWKAATQPPTTRFDFGPYFVSTGGALLMAGTTGSTTSVWSSSDGLTWTQVSDANAFDMSGRRFVAQGMTDDGHGGLVMVGNSVGSTSTDVTATAWTSHDGRSWSAAQVNAGQGQEMIGGVAAGNGSLVAAGNGIAWYSTSGDSWFPVGVPASQAFIPRAVGSFNGGFVIVGLATGTGGVRSAAWYSPDGRVWTQATTVLAGFDARGIASSGGRIVAVGSDTSDTAEGMAASWTSTDGNKWTKATAPTTQNGVAIDGITTLDGSFIAVGAPDTTSQNQAAAGSPAPLTEEAWITDDGMGWASLGPNGTPVPRGHLASVDGKLVLAGQGKSGVAVLQGTPALGPHRVVKASTSPAIVYSLDLTAGNVPMIPDVTTTDTLGPVVATSDRFVAFTTGGAGTSIWTSTDGGHLWAQEAKPAALTASGNTGRPVILKAIADGKGSVLAIGSVTNASGSTGTIWRREKDGWKQVNIQDDAPPRFSSIAAGTNGYVVSSDKAGGSSVMYSTDGNNWYASTIPVGDGFALTVSTYQYGFIAVGTNAARGGASSAWTSPDGRTWTLRADWKLPPNVTALFGVGKGLVATSTVTPGISTAAPSATPAAAGSGASPTGKATPTKAAKATPTPKPTPAPKPYTQWWWSGSGQAWQQTPLQTSSTNYAMVNNEIFVIDPPASGTDWTTWSSADGRTWFRPVSDPISFPGAKVCALASLGGNKLVIVGWEAAGRLKGYFGTLTSQ